MSDTVTTNREEGVVTIALDDGKANALGSPVLEAILAALDQAESDGDAVLLTGREGMFSAGFDLKVFQAGGEELVRMLELGATLMERILGFPRPVVIAASGHAMAAGAFLLLAADARIGAEGSFKIGLNESQIGLTLPWPVIELARYRLDPRRMDESVVGARIYSPAEAAEIGYLDRVVAPDALGDEAREAAGTLAGLDARAFAENKQRLRGPAVDAVRVGTRRMMDEFRQALAAG